MNMKKGSLSRPKIGTFIDPLTDFGFKFLFGREPSKELLIDFLNELFKGRKVITDLIYNKNERQGPRADSRTIIFDLTCTGQDGEQFIIEIQRIKQKYFKDRAVYYTSRLIHDQAPKGGAWDYSLKEVYFIGLMDFFLEDSDKDEFLHWVRLVYEKSGNEFYSKLAYIFIEIPKFTKTEMDLKTGVDKWMFVLKNMSGMQKIPAILNTRIFSKLFNIASVSNLTKEEYMSYEKDLKEIWDEYATRKTLEHEHTEAIEIAKAKAAEKGMEKGMDKKSYIVVRNLLLAQKFTIEEISNFAQVTESFVRKVKKEIKNES